MNLLPTQKFLTPESLYPHHVQRDSRKELECARKFDAEAGIKINPQLKDELLTQLGHIQRRIPFLSEEHMFALCSGMHERKVPANISLAIRNEASRNAANRNVAMCRDFNARSDCESKPRWNRV